tara:strand:+ start:692 stop:1969 length:1278 start_codon:yes stop_codon:yes gene_type:complete
MPHGGSHKDDDMRKDATIPGFTPTEQDLAQFRPHLQLEQRTEDKRKDNITGGPAMDPAYQDAEFARFKNQYVTGGFNPVDPSQDPIFGNFGANADFIPSRPDAIYYGEMDTGGGGGGGGDFGVGAAYENYFANQEQAVQDKFDSIKDYLDELQISSDEGFAADMDRITNMYTERADARNDRFEEALKRPELRQGAAIETLAEIGIQADPSLFDPITGATQDMLFSQQMSGADMLNTMSYITETIYDFAKNEQDLSIAAGMENAQQNLISDMAAIQMARDAQAISTAQAAQAAAAAQEESDKLMQAYITMGASIGMSPEVAMAYGELGMLGDAYDTYTDPNNPTMTTVLGGQQVPVTVDQFIAAENLGLDQAQFAASQTPEGYATMVDGQIVVLPFNQVAPFFEAADQYGIDIKPVPLEGDGTEGS